MRRHRHWWLIFCARRRSMVWCCWRRSSSRVSRPTFAGFIVGALVVFIGLILFVAAMTLSNVQMFADGSSRIGAFIWTWGIRADAVVGSVALLVWLYRRRDVSRAAWISGRRWWWARASRCSWKSARRGSFRSWRPPAPTAYGRARPGGAQQYPCGRRPVPRPPSQRAEPTAHAACRRCASRRHGASERWVEHQDRADVGRLPFDNPASMLPQGVRSFDARVGPTSVHRDVAHVSAGRPRPGDENRHRRRRGERQRERLPSAATRDGHVWRVGH